MKRSLRILLVPFGSEGDVNPLVWLAHGLRERGHQPEVVVNPHYAHRVRDLKWHPIGTESDFEKIAGDPVLWKPGRGTLRIAEIMAESLPHYQSVISALPGKFDLVVTTSFSFGAVCVAEAMGVPRLMLHLQPVCIRGMDDFPLATEELRIVQSMPHFFKRIAYCFMDLGMDCILLPRVNAFRQTLRLPQWKGFYNDALMSGEGIGLLYPEWFGAPQPEWPTRARQFGFPLDQAAPSALPQDLQAWIDAGDAPVVWTHGSANLHVADFQDLAIRVGESLGIRTLLVSRVAPKVGTSPNVFHVRHVAFENLFHHCRAVVHHAGIGTTAKAFVAGIPQLAIPLAHDQFDNAQRIVRLGAGLRSRKRFRSAREAMRRLLGSDFAAGVARCQALSLQPGRIGQLCEFAEELALKPMLQSASQHSPGGSMPLLPQQE